MYSIMQSMKDTVEFRTYQQVTSEKVLETLEKYQSALVESPTGSGKTIMALLIAKYMQEKYGYSIGWCAMRRNLLVQVEEENKRKKFNVDMKYISMFDKNPPQVDFLIVDEAHHDPTDSMTTIHGIIKPKKILGLTATPFRSDNVAITFDKVIRETNIFQLIRDDFLSQFTHYTIPDWTPKEVVKTYVSEKEKWGKSVIFFHREVQCREAEELLNKAGVRCEVVTSQTDRYRQLDEFDAGKIDVLINMMILTEGFDCPNLNTVFVRPSNKNATVQMCGRVLRKMEGMSKNIVQCSNTRHPFSKYSPTRSRYIRMDTDEWVSLDPDVRHDQLRVKMIKLITKAPVDHATIDAIKGITEINRKVIKLILDENTTQDEEKQSKKRRYSLDEDLYIMHLITQGGKNKDVYAAMPNRPRLSLQYRTRALKKVYKATGFPGIYLGHQQHFFGDGDLKLRLARIEESLTADPEPEEVEVA